jgi:hypothetical protein
MANGGRHKTKHGKSHKKRKTSKARKTYKRN